jgi:hypothetical protein
VQPAIANMAPIATAGEAGKTPSIDSLSLETMAAILALVFHG